MPSFGFSRQEKRMFYDPKTRKIGKFRLFEDFQTTKFLTRNPKLSISLAEGIVNNPKLGISLGWNQKQNY